MSRRSSEQRFGTPVLPAVLGYWDPPVSEVVGDTLGVDQAVCDLVGEWLVERTLDEVAVLEVAVDATRTAGVAGVAEELAVLLGGEAPGVAEAHAPTPPSVDRFFVKYLLLRSDTLE